MTTGFQDISREICAQLGAIILLPENNTSIYTKCIIRKTHISGQALVYTKALSPTPKNSNCTNSNTHVRDSTSMLRDYP